MMKILVLSPTTLATLAAIAKAATGNAAFVSTATLRPDGDYDVPMSEATVDRLAAHRLEGETDDALLQRLLALAEVIGRLPPGAPLRTGLH